MFFTNVTMRFTSSTDGNGGPKEYIDGFIPKDFRVQRTYLDEIARMVSIHVTANNLTLPLQAA